MKIVDSFTTYTLGTKFQTGRKEVKKNIEDEDVYECDSCKRLILDESFGGYKVEPVGNQVIIKRFCKKCWGKL